MKTCHALAGSLCCLIWTTAAQAAPLTTYFPPTGLGSFLAEKFDLASIRSSIGPRRTPALRTFSDLGLKPNKATDDSVSFERENWFHELRIVERGDVNGDGIEDLKACFVDRAVSGPTYHATKGLLITRYAPDAYAVALSFSVDDACDKPAYLSGPTAR
ncbi:hypothetical protein [Massilia niabensis]|uniref:Uncharacterized protein n=1 Tax=Massilia niabensis TaxID=544910 RepID=A0ABW0L5D1_9BURK